MSDDRITGTVTQVDVAARAPEWAKQQWNVTLRCGGRRSASPVVRERHASTPTVAEIVECLELDSSYADSFDEFCDELGYDSDSRTAERLYKAVRRQSVRFAAFTEGE